MRQRTVICTVAILAGCMLPASSFGDIVLWTAAFPSDLRLNKVEHNTEIRLFEEQITFQLGSDLDYDILGDGTYHTNNQGTSGQIPAGGWVDCYLLHADPVGTATSLIPYTGTVTFDNPILGVIVKDSTLSSSDAIVGRVSTTYALRGGTNVPGHFSGLDFFEQPSRGIQDYITISGNTVTLNIKAADRMDAVRVITGPTAFEVQIDIKPGSYPNSINEGSNGVIPVAIFSTDIFDATQIDPATVTLAGAGVPMKGRSGKYMAHEEDVNGDGLPDLVVQVETEAFDSGNLTPEGEAVLTGTAYDGWLPITGSDTVQIVPVG